MNDEVTRSSGETWQERKAVVETGLIKVSAEQGRMAEHAEDIIGNARDDQVAGVGEREAFLEFVQG